MTQGTANPEVTILRVFLEQHVLHCRHLETERYWLMSVYAIVVGGVSALMVKGQIPPDTMLRPEWIYVFLVGLTFFGLLQTMRWTYIFEVHRARAEKVADMLWEASGTDKARIPIMTVEPTPLFRGFLKKANRLIGTRYLFPVFYLLILVGLTLFSHLCSLHGWCQGIGIGLSSIAVITVVRWTWIMRIAEPS
jgi:hypothetical protein